MTSEKMGGFDQQIAATIAPSWERRRAEIEEVASPAREWMLRELRPGPGDTVLELAAGVGDTGFDVVEAVGEGGRLISTDVSPEMLDTARRRGAERGVANVEYRVIDAEHIELDEDSVDGVICRFGYMLMADPAAALAETRRVLRPGGRLVLAVWGAPERNPFFLTVALALVRHGHMPPPEPPPAPGLFSMAGPDRTTALLRDAGFGEIRLEDVAISFSFPGVDEYLSMLADTAGPLALVLRGLSDADRAPVRDEVADAVARFSTPDGYELPGAVLCAVAS